ncbi:MAG: hypothetical protein BWX54_02007 [Verrucomicrobia bacterium ADurb.Bin018]|nr:MAG: hypothetical protein BWX54_02007 [Verrucomicrobia bacterium ADurb.Bin018]
MVRGAGRHHMLQRRAGALVNHRAAATGAPHAIARALRRRARRAARLVHNHHVIARVLGPRQPHHRFAIHRRRGRRRIRQDRHAPRRRRSRAVVQERAAPIVRIDGNMIRGARGKTRHRHLAGLAGRRIDHIVAGANLASAAKGRTGSIVGPIGRIRADRTISLDQNDRAIGGTRVVPDDLGAGPAHRQERGQRGAAGRLARARRGIRARNGAGCPVVIRRVSRCAVMGVREYLVVVRRVGRGAVAVGNVTRRAGGGHVNHRAVANGVALRIGRTIRRRARRRRARLAHNDVAVRARRRRPFHLDLRVRQRRRRQRPIRRRLHRKRVPAARIPARRVRVVVQRRVRAVVLENPDVILRGRAQPRQRERARAHVDEHVAAAQIRGRTEVVVLAGIRRAIRREP